mmetsp:Transcript_43852/g.71315  ORF Transcript_43852/g.71315 Transcript_43852/m.71315 type:complete len:229 (+) Transcript_43852:177-863(+)|eukprot:CAMPEP_0184671498 /NCGR_PEP_ID=MMETSP0308-20130426/85542_1 /TAXON_ID=38269 /ORGANISM="Gloeochaete witrockiana, Strain SAG 46.84" /LENGTH=228 /DNA_ID=CAMNT_0027118647 /DNA_START=158 /DNA_END=844 /DNA_ORIENTATION=+
MAGAVPEAGGNVKYLGVARLEDKALLATYRHDRSDINRSNAKVKELMQKGQISASKANSLEFEDGKLHFTSDSSFVYFVGTSQSYPSRSAFQLLNTFSKTFKETYGHLMQTAIEDGLSKKAKLDMKNFATKYDDLQNVDKIASVSKQVDQVKTVMNDNIQIMLQNQQSLENLNETTDMLTKESKAFQKKATTVKRSMWCKNLKMTLILTAIIVVILVIIIASIVSKFK